MKYLNPKGRGLPFIEWALNQALQWTPTLRDFLCHSLRSFYGTKTRSVPGPLNLALCVKRDRAMESEECPDCGAKSVKAFVHYGSYFTRCTACEYSGPATSWMAIGPKIEGHIYAILLDGAYKQQELIAAGKGSDIYQAVGRVAGQGKCVLLTNSATNA